jgi:hypothetical protein
MADNDNGPQEEQKSPTPLMSSEYKNSRGTVKPRALVVHRLQLGDLSARRSPASSNAAASLPSRTYRGNSCQGTSLHRIPLLRHFARSMWQARHSVRTPPMLLSCAGYRGTTMRLSAGSSN